jgi:hypothetical protein
LFFTFEKGKKTLNVYLFPLDIEEWLAQNIHVCSTQKSKPPRKQSSFDFKSNILKVINVFAFREPISEKLVNDQSKVVPQIQISFNNSTLKLNPNEVVLKKEVFRTEYAPYLTPGIQSTNEEDILFGTF